MSETPEERIADLRRSIEEIGEFLKGPLSNTERAWAVADRRDLREAIKYWEAKAVSA